MKRHRRRRPDEIELMEERGKREGGDYKPVIVSVSSWVALGVFTGTTVVVVVVLIVLIAL